MNTGRKQQPTRGLPAIASGRAGREKGRFSRPTPLGAVLVFGGCLGVFLCYQWITGSKIDKGRNQLMSRQKAVSETIGKEWDAMAKRVEGHVVTVGGKAGLEDFRDPDFSPQLGRAGDFRSAPSIYVRLRVSDAASAVLVRKAAEVSVQDAFSTCLMRDAPGTPFKAPPPVNPMNPLAEESDDAPTEKRLWNLKDGYHAARIFTDDYRSELSNISDDLRLRVYTDQFKKAEERDIPRAVALIKRAHYLLVLLDEVPDDFQRVDGGAPSVADLEPAPHWVRVGLFDVRTDRVVARLRRRVDAEFRPIGGRALSADAKTAMQRQGNNCALAQEVVAFLK
jgi:hypothetical protein